LEFFLHQTLVILNSMTKEIYKMSVITDFVFVRYELFPHHFLIQNILYFLIQNILFKYINHVDLMRES